MIIGIDEVGRGCWAGPLVVAAVGLPNRVRGLADSKTLSKAKRDSLDQEIRRNSTFVYVAAVPAARIDTIGLSQSLQVSCQKLFSQFSKQNHSRIVIDGNINYLSEQPKTETMVRADQQLEECMAASIVAKVWRDNYMAEIAKQYPEYGFERHVGYGTKVHAAALAEYGPCPEHRYSFKPVKYYAQQRTKS